MNRPPGGFGSGRIGGSRVGTPPRIGTPRPRVGTPTRPRVGTGTTTRTVSPRPQVSGQGHTVIVHNHSYPISGGGWGYGYYDGYHPVFVHWYGYPIYYGSPVHWSGWTWSWAPLLALLLLGALAWFIWQAVAWARR